MTKSLSGTMTREEMEIWLNYKSGNMAENMLGNMKGGKWKYG